jgi:hypothetical protein
VSPDTLIQTWRALRIGRSSAGEDQIVSTPVLYEGVATDLELAVDVSGDLHLFAPVTGPPDRNLPPDYNGLRLRLRRLGGADYLDLHSPAAHEPMFAMLCAQVVEAIYLHGRQPWAATIAIVRGWHSAWKPVRQPISRSVQIGLAGELIILWHLWIPALGSEAVHLWSGPDQERHDFTGERIHMEVKSTTRSRHEHEISRVDQLRVPAGRRLLFASVQLEASSGGTESLASLIDAILSDLAHDPAAVDAFLTKITGLDWSDEMRRSPELFRFHLRDAQIFEVDDEFPRLSDDLELSGGVIAIRYTISLANLPFLDTATVMEDITPG